MNTIKNSGHADRIAFAFRRFGADRSGAVMLEFAFVVIPFIGLMLAVLQVGLIFFANQLLDTAAQASARVIMTGGAQKAGMSQSDFKQQACNRLPNFMDCTKLTVDVVSGANFAALNTAAPTITYSSGNPVFPNRYTPGIANNYVMVRLMYPWNVVGAPNGMTLASLQNGQFLLMATSVTKTEPYQ